MAKAVEIERILVRAPNWIGDAVMCLPAIRALKGLYPRSEITVLGKGRVLPVFENNPAVAELIEYDSSGRHGGLSGRLRLSREIKSKGFQMAVLFQNAFDAAFLSFISGIPERVGYSRDLRKRLLTRAIPATKEIRARHQSEYYLNIVRALGGGGAPADGADPEIRLKKEETAWAREFLRQNGLEGRPLAGVAPGASYGAAKRWPPERFAETLGLLSKEYNLVPVIFGGSDDCAASSGVASRISGRVLNLAGRTTLRQCMAVLNELECFITNDSGLMHVAAALDVPTVAVFGSTDPALTGPPGRRAAAVSKAAPCSPCFERECRYGHYKCLKAVTSGEVFEAARLLMARGGAAGGRSR